MSKLVLVSVFIIAFITGSIPALLVLHFANLKQPKKKRAKVFIGYFLITVPMFLFLMLSLIFKSV